MLCLNLKAVCKLRGIHKPYAWLVKAGFPVSIALKLNQEDYANLPLAHLEKLCLLLHCTPHDLLRWTPDPSVETAHQPLAILLDTHNEDLDWIDQMSTKSVAELRAIGQKLSRIKDDEA